MVLIGDLQTNIDRYENMDPLADPVQWVRIIQFVLSPPLLREKLWVRDTETEVCELERFVRRDSFYLFSKFLWKVLSIVVVLHILIEVIADREVPSERYHTVMLVNE